MHRDEEDVDSDVWFKKRSMSHGGGALTRFRTARNSAPDAAADGYAAKVGATSTIDGGDPAAASTDATAACADAAAAGPADSSAGPRCTSN